jgi:hypothetical protein
MSVLHRSQSIGVARLYLTFTSPSTTASELHTCTIQAKRRVAHIAFAMVVLVTTQPSSWITLTITHHKGTFQPCVRNLPLMSALATPTHKQLEQKKKKKKRKQRAQPNDQKSKKSQNKII